MKNIVYLMPDNPHDGDLLYGYTFLFDPFVLAVTKNIPKMKMFCSPYYARVVSRAGTVDLFNRGAQFYYRNDRCIFQHLIGNNDTLHHFHYAIAVNNTQRHPLLSALDWQTPILTATAKHADTWSLAQSRAPNLLLFGANYIGDKTFILRMAELDGHQTRTMISCGEDLRRVVETDYLGRPIRPIKHQRREFTFSLPPWGIAEVRIQFK